jgi:hypothetical protein
MKGYISVSKSRELLTSLTGRKGWLHCLKKAKDNGFVFGIEDKYNDGRLLLYKKDAIHRLANFVNNKYATV